MLFKKRFAAYWKARERPATQFRPIRPAPPQLPASLPRLPVALNAATVEESRFKPIRGIARENPNGICDLSKNPARARGLDARRKKT
jgi:hypothetical protein